MSYKFRIIIKPREALIDQSISIKLEGFPPGEVVALEASMVDGRDNQWNSRAAFITGEDGSIDLTKQKPLSGSYGGIDPMGLFWSMESGSGEGYYWSLEPKIFTFTAYLNGEEAASAQFRQLPVDPEVEIEKVREDGMVGTFFKPPGDKPRPAVIVLGGSGGGLIWTENMAALIASRGFQSLALAYFNLEDLPVFLSEIPLEYFESAIAWLKRKKSVDPEKIAVLGNSKGAELALVLGATFRDIKAVIGYSANSLVTQGLNPDLLKKPTSSWSFKGKPVPFMPLMGAEKILKPGMNEPISLRDCYLENLMTNPAAEEATIPVEKINGPILIISGEDDQLIPSDVFGDIIMDRLRESNHPYHFEHICYEGAGHSLAYINTPATRRKFSLKYMDIGLAIGGSPEDTARSKYDSWPRILEFLEESLGK